MTVHNFVESFQIGETRTIPSNCTFKDLYQYGFTRFNYSFKKIGRNEIKRVCPVCGR